MCTGCPRDVPESREARCRDGESRFGVVRWQGLALGVICRCVNGGWYGGIMGPVNRRLCWWNAACSPLANYLYSPETSLKRMTEYDEGVVV